MNADADTYAATSRQRGGSIRGQVRNAYAGLISECAHAHKTISTALACADKQLERQS